MSLKDRAAIVGVGETKIGRIPVVTILGFELEAGAKTALVALVALGISLWIGCAPGAREAVAPAKKDEPQYGGIFQHAPPDGTDSLNPHLVAAKANINPNLRPFFQSLLRPAQASPTDNYRTDFRMDGLLAERWEMPNDTTIIFYLRKGVKWHDGVEFTAEDVAFTFAYLADPSNNLPRGGSVAIVVERVEALDRYTVRMTLKQPKAELLIMLADTDTIIMPKHVYDSGEDFRKVAIGTGPFKLKSYDRQRGIVAVRNEDYWEKGKPYVDGIKILYGLDKSARIAALKARENDLDTITDKAQFDAIYRVTPDLQYFPAASDANHGYRFKMDRPPFDDVRVRRAFHLAIDRNALIERVGMGEGVVNGPLLPAAKTGWGIPPEEFMKWPGWRQPKDQDIAEARRLLSEAGYPQGFKTSVDYGLALTTQPLSAEVVAEQLRKVGIEMVLRGLDSPTGNKRYRDGDYEITMIDGRIFSDIDRNLPLHWHSKSTATKSGLNDPELDQLIDMESRELNVEERKKLVERLARLFYDKMYYVPTIDPINYLVWQPYVHGIYTNFTSYPWLMRPAELWLEAAKVSGGRSLD